jgi:hypothetical protein
MRAAAVYDEIWSFLGQNVLTAAVYQEEALERT